MRLAALLIVVLGGVAVATGFWANYVWDGMDGTEMSIHGWIALGLGVVFTLAIVLIRLFPSGLMTRRRRQV